MTTKVDESTFNYYEHVKRTTGFLETREWVESSTVTYKAYAQAGTAEDANSWIAEMIVTTGGKVSTYVACNGKPQALWEKKDPDTGDVIESVKDFFDEEAIPLPEPITHFHYKCAELPVDMPITTYISMPHIEGGTPPYTYSVVTGAPEIGLDTDAASAKVGGLYLAAAHTGIVGNTYTIEVLVTDAQGVVASVEHTITLCESFVKYNLTCLQMNSSSIVSLSAVEGQTYSLTGGAMYCYLRYNYTDTKQYIYSMGNDDPSLIIGIYALSGSVYVEHALADGTLYTAKVADIPTQRWFSLSVVRDIVNTTYFGYVNGSVGYVVNYSGDEVAPTFLQVTGGIGGRDHVYGTIDLQGKGWQGLMSLFGVSDQVPTIANIQHQENNFNRPFNLGYAGAITTAYYKMGNGDTFATITDHVHGNDGVMLGLSASDFKARGWANRGYTTLNGIDQGIKRFVGDAGGDYHFTVEACTMIVDMLGDFNNNACSLVAITRPDGNNSAVEHYIDATTAASSRLHARMIEVWNSSTLDLYYNGVGDNLVRNTHTYTYDGSMDASGFIDYKNGVVSPLNISHNTLSGDTLQAGTDYTVGIMYKIGSIAKGQLHGAVFFNTVLPQSVIQDIHNVMREYENIFNIPEVDINTIEGLFYGYESADISNSKFKTLIGSKHFEMLGANQDQKVRY